MEAADSTTARFGVPYPEETLLEAYNLEWESIELRRQRLQKTWQQFLLMEEMEKEELRYKRQLRRLKRQEQEKQARELAERERVEALRRQREGGAEKMKKLKKLKKAAVSGTQSDEEESVPRWTKETKVVKPKVLKSKTQPKQSQKTKPALPKRIIPISMPSVQPEDEESVSEENQNEFGGYDSPPPELPDDGLLNMLSLDKGSDSDDVDDEPSMVSLILPVAPDSPKRVQPSPLKKKTLTPQKRFAKKKGVPPLDFNFTNAEARRQAKAEAEAAAQADHGESDDAEPEPMPVPSTSTPKKHLKRRKDQKANGVTASGGKSLMAAMANTTIPVRPKKGIANSVTGRAKTAASGSAAVQKKGPQTKTKPQPKNAKSSVGEEGDSTAPPTRKKFGGKKETMSIKQRLANAELLARMNKMQDISTPKVLGKKTKKAQKQESAQTLAAKRAEFRKVLATDAAEPDVSSRDQMSDEGDLNISLNSSGLLSDNDSPENMRVPTRKRPRGAVDGDVTPTKKLQFLEITKRLAKSPMPRYLRTPTPLMSPVVASGHIKPKAASPGPRAASVRNTATTRRLNSAPVRPKKTANANRFGIPAGGANTASNGGGFSMFDAFVNSGSTGAIPRLKTKTRGNVSPSV
ncbi:hypothetical protein PHYPSEUDO_002858 [Phytophthora pseudosyringae]|uniref:Uncharacterized protein n=1 Tax=Phytophthora pseudosyringae TaxID=221518 RepID=A0A8T1VSD3_9STRA|nr:hypothetical protein PHYPSEUDO_002858 [Phytophthora pseudosyringae]